MALSLSFNCLTLGIYFSFLDIQISKAYRGACRVHIEKRLISLYSNWHTVLLIKYVYFFVVMLLRMVFWLLNHKD